MDDERTTALRVPEEVLRPALRFGPWFIGAGLWAFANFPERMQFTEPMFARVFGLLSGLYDAWTEVPGYGEALDEALEEIRRPPSKILDLATGTGYVARRLVEKFPEAEVTGLDISPEMIAIAQHQAVAEDKKMKFEVGALSDLPFEDGSFDLVVQQNAMPYPNELMRVVASRGSALYVWSFAGPWVSLAWPSLARRLSGSGAITVFGQQAGLGYFGVARKT
jgi:SAM-dependent methyltransferase